MSVDLAGLQARARRAIAAWNLPEQEPELLKYRENAVFKVYLADGAKAALRLHRPGYHSEAALRSELLWMNELRRNGLDVPQPIAACSGAFLVDLGGEPPMFADLIGWVDGRQSGEGGKPLDYDEGQIIRIYSALGAAMAEMHDVSDRWTPPHTFVRGAWDCDGLLGDAPLWGRFWDCPGIRADDATFLRSLRARLQGQLEAVAESFDYGLIHADLVRENVLVDGERVALIDFDDCGHGFRLFDIATTLLRNRRERHYGIIQASLIDGYRSRRPLSDESLVHLPLFLLLRSLTYIGWAGARPELPDAEERLARYIADARSLTEEVCV